MADPDPRLGTRTTYTLRGVADATVEMLASCGIISEVVENGRFWGVKIQNEDIPVPRLAGPKRLHGPKPAAERTA